MRLDNNVAASTRFSAVPQTSGATENLVDYLRRDGDMPIIYCFSYVQSRHARYQKKMSSDMSRRSSTV